MPGKKNSSNANASFITDWFLHRSAIAVADNPADPSLVVPTIDLRSSESAFDNQIWVGVVRTAGAATVDITIWRKENGTWAAVVPWVSEGTQAAMVTATIKKFTGLPAGEYKVLATNITAANVWNIHVAHT